MHDGFGTDSRRPTLTSAYLAERLPPLPPAANYWIAYSGGLDSTVLLHLLADVRAQHMPDLKLRAIHVHHGLQSAAEHWVTHCQRVCQSLAIDLQVLRVDARPLQGQSPEEAARLARYKAIKQNLQAGDLLLLAQHQDDQAETVLLQLMRGAGIDGLAAMPAHGQIDGIPVARPLLEFDRTRLARYAHGQALTWVDDASNHDPAFDRNYLRQQVLPLIRQRWPGFAQTLSRSARHCAETQQYLHAFTNQHLPPLLGDSPRTLRLSALQQHSDYEQRLLLRQWIKSCGFRHPPHRTMEAILCEVLAARPDRQPVVRWAEGSIRRYRNQLYLTGPETDSNCPADGPPISQTVASARASPPAARFDAEQVRGSELDRLVLPGNGILMVHASEGHGIRREHWQPGSIRVEYRQGGERLRLPDRDGSHALKKLFQEAGIPPWLRNRWPLVFLGDRLAWAGADWYAAEFAANGLTESVRLQWRPDED